MITFKYIDLLGKPYGPDGYDCYSLVRELYKRLDIELPEFISTDDRCLIHQMINENRILFENLEKSEPYCIVLFTIRPPFISHIGMVLEDCNSFIHVAKGINVSVERLDSLLWKNRIKGFIKWKKNSV